MGNRWRYNRVLPESAYKDRSYLSVEGIAEVARFFWFRYRNRRNFKYVIELLYSVQRWRYNRVLPESACTDRSSFIGKGIAEVARFFWFLHRNKRNFKYFIELLYSVQRWSYNRESPESACTDRSSFSGKGIAKIALVFWFRYRNRRNFKYVIELLNSVQRWRYNRVLP